MPVPPAFVYVPSNTTGMIAPLHPQAIMLPVLAFPSWILCIPPLFWHFRQRNIAAGSLILWVAMINFFNSINPLIWPRDNLDQWWDGNVWCDINVRIQVGAIVGTTASITMIVRKLAKVMDTRNITVSSSRNSKLKELALDIVWCWVYPLVFIVLYYVVQPARYMIFGITGCMSVYDISWPSIVLSFMWAPITTLVAACYATLLSYRLYRYRREFIRLVAARNTTKSRFIRLFIICLIVIVAYLPYTIWLLLVLCRAVTDPYSWSRVHDPTRFNTVLRVPALGTVTIDKWAQVATGYILFFVFGTGSDAYNTYKVMLVACGLGKCFPSLYVLRESGSSSPRSFVAARTWTSELSSRAKSMFWSRSQSMIMSVGGSTTDGSVVVDSMPQLRPVTTEEPILPQPSAQPSIFTRIFGRRSRQHNTVLPLFARRSHSITEMTDTHTQKSVTRDRSPGVTSHAWAADESSERRVSETDGVRVFREVHLECQELDGDVKEGKEGNA